MNRSTATIAIVNARLRSQRRLIVAACVAAALVGLLQPHGIAATSDPFAADLATRSVWLAGPMFFCSLLGIFVALAQRGDARTRMLELCEQSAPLFGRELARAKALVPCIIAALATLVYWLAQFVGGFAAPPAFFVLALAAVLASALVALSATVRNAATGILYVALAALATCSAFGLAVYADAIGPKPPRALGHYNDAIGIATELAFCALVGFFALRQYGEALARYDPVD
jgi:hypothetical protein